LGMNIPIFFGAHERIEAQRQKNQAIIEKKDAEVNLLNAQSDRILASRDYQSTHKRLEELRSKDLPLAEAMMESTNSSYKAGKLGFAELILARKTLADLRVQDIQLRRTLLSDRLRCLQNCQVHPDQKERLMPYETHQEP
jgi:outer membrane protein TolC